MALVKGHMCEKVAAFRINCHSSHMGIGGEKRTNRGEGLFFGFSMHLRSYIFFVFFLINFQNFSVFFFKMTVKS